MSTTVPELQNDSDNLQLIRKVQHAIGLFAPMDVPLPATLSDGNGGLTALPEGWVSVGAVTPDGFSFSASSENDEIPALGYGSPVRTDVISVERQITFTALEYGKRQIMEILYGQDLSAVTQAAGGEITFDEVDLPIGAEWRFMVIGGDGPVGANWILGKAYPRVKLAERGEETWAKEGALQTEITLDVFTDSDEGTPTRHFIAGTGAASASDVLGFDA